MIMMQRQRQWMICVLLLLVATGCDFTVVTAIKGESSSSSRTSLRSLQGPPPPGGQPPGGESKEGGPLPPPGGESKEGGPLPPGPPGKEGGPPPPGGGVAKKEDPAVKEAGVVPPPADPKKDTKKCKKAAPKLAPPSESSATEPATSPIVDETAPAPPADHEHGDTDELYCLQGDVTEEECQNAKSGKLPKGHKSIRGDVEIHVSYVTGSSPTDVLNKVEDIIRSGETASDFLGCDKPHPPPPEAAPDQRRQQEQDSGNAEESSTTTEGGGEAATTPTEDEEEDVRVTGVDFQKVEIAKEGDCTSKDSDRNCDTIRSNVEIFYQNDNEGEELTEEEKQEMLALLVATIEEQAANGAFDDVGTVESVEIVNNGQTGSTGGNGSSGGGGGGGNLGKGGIAGIPSGIGGLIAIAIAGCVIYKFLGRDSSDDNNQNKDVDIDNTNSRVVEAQAVVMDDPNNPAMSEKENIWQKCKNQFL